MASRSSARCLVKFQLRYAGAGPAPPWHGHQDILTYNPRLSAQSVLYTLSVDLNVYEHQTTSIGFREMDFTSALSLAVRAYEKMPKVIDDGPPITLVVTDTDERRLHNTV